MINIDEQVILPNTDNTTNIFEHIKRYQSFFCSVTLYHN